jgi:hypothetical protein
MAEKALNRLFSDAGNSFGKTTARVFQAVTLWGMEEKYCLLK